MATVQIPAPTTTAGGVDQTVVQTDVQIKTAWSDAAWTTVDYLDALECVDCVAPSMPTARLRFRYGELLRRDATAWATATHLSLVGGFVRIRSLDGDEPTVLWTGVVDVEDHRAYAIGAAGTTPVGDQEFTAYGLQHLLDRAALSAGWYDADGTATQVRRLPRFNERSGFGRSVLGNRSSSTYESSRGESYLFARDGEAWTVRQVIDYLLTRHLETGVPTFQLSGQTSLLDVEAGVLDLQGKTLMQALNQLIDRRRGAGWCLRVSGTKPQIHVFSVVGTAVSVGDETVAANDDIWSIDLDDEGVVDAAIRLNESARYDRVEVLGGRVVSCFSVSVAAGNLEAGWTAAEESDYDSPGGATVEEQDARRRGDDLRRVFRHYRLPPDWDGAGVNPATGNATQARVYVDDEGDRRTSTDSAYFHDNRPLLRWLPLTATAAATAAAPEYLPPLAFIVNDTQAVQLDVYESETVQACRVRAADRESAIEIAGRMNHVLGLNHFSGDSRVAAAWDYEDLVCTVALELDECLHVVAELPENEQLAAPRTLTIEVPDAELWVVAAGTMTGVQDDEPVVTEEVDEVRNDADRLRRIAALALAWYGTQRQQVRVRYSSVRQTPQVGVYIREASSGGRRAPVGTVLTEVRHQFEEQTTRLRTGHQELDVASLAGRRGVAAGMPRARGLPGADQGEPAPGGLPGREGTVADGLPMLYEATADESSGTITAQRVNPDGSLSGDDVTFAVPTD